jgi:NitT/TauT family transport system substrate-binding protein
MVHLAKLPENLAFFCGAIDAAGSFEGIYQSAVYAYGNELIKDPAPAKRFLDLSHLEALDKSGAYKDQVVAIAPIRSQAAGASLEENPLLSKDIRFQFLPNESKLDLGQQENLARLDSIKQLLKVSPGSVVLLRGHVDDAKVAEFRKQGGESYVRQMSLKAMQLSQDRANEIKRLLIERQGVDEKRIDTRGLGWNEPMSNEPNPDKRSELNRRVEVQWFTVE